MSDANVTHLGPDKSRIHIKLGSLEIEFEGSEAFLENHLPNLVELLGGIEPPELEEFNEAEIEGALLEATDDASPNKLDMSTSMIVNKLGGTSGRDLLMAAAAHLHFAEGHEKYSRANLLAEMKTATTYYKKTYSNNLTQYLNAAVKAGDLNELADNTYALHDSKVKSLEAALGAK